MVAADAARVRELWEAPDQVSAADVPLLESLVAEYPAAVPLWWLYVRAVQRAEAPQFSQVLQRCAAVSPDRSALMAWVEAPLLPVAAADRPAAPAEPVAPAKPAASAEPVAPAKPAAPAAPAVEVPTVPKAAAPRAPKVPTVPEAAAPQAPVPAPKFVVPQAPAEVNLDALPEKVREQILRARALKAKLTQGSSQPEAPAAASIVSAQPAPKSTPVSATKPSRPTAVKPAAPPAPEVAVAPPAPKAVAAPPAPEALRGGAEQESAPDLSPFARFVAQLAEQNRPKSEDLIDQFLTANPRISPVAKDAPVAEVRTQPDAQVTGLVTETLARMYAEQGHVAKAIQAYEILKLRVPEKSMIFAARIEALRNS